LGVRRPLICSTPNFEKGIFRKKSLQADALHSLQNLLFFNNIHLFIDKHDVFETFKKRVKNNASN
jgi:hypothetical protein